MGGQADDGIFQIPARRCRRCGGLLTSAAAIRDGYGHTCKMKARMEAAELAEQKLQYSLFNDSEEAST